MNNPGLYKTKTLNIAGFLQTKGCRLLDVNREGWQSAFIFEDTPELLRLVEAYLYSEENHDDVMVDARKLISAIKDLKLKIYL